MSKAEASIPIPSGRPVKNRREVIEIYATRWLDFSSKCTKNAFGGIGSARTRWGSLQRSALLQTP